MKECGFKDLQTDSYSHHTTIEGLFSMLCEGYCECGQGYDKLDKKDNKMKCINCYKLNHIDEISDKEMIQEILENKYAIDYISMTIEDIKNTIDEIVQSKNIDGITFVEVKEECGKNVLSIFIDGKSIKNQQSLLEDVVCICNEGLNTIELYSLKTLSKILGIEIKSFVVQDKNIIKLIAK